MSGLKFEITNSRWGIARLEYDGQHEFPILSETGEIFRNDPLPLVRFKCAAIVVLTPLATLMRSVCWATEEIFRAISQTYRQIDGEDLSQEKPASLKNALIEVGRTWYYFPFLMGYALQGLVNPAEGRLNYGITERLLLKHETPKIRERHYVAVCFQPMGNQKDPKKAEKKIVKYLKVIEMIKKIHSALFRCNLKQIYHEYKSFRSIHPK